MAMTLTTPNTILGTLQPRSDAARLVLSVVTVILGTVLLTISAKTQVPTWPVPVTLQTLAIAGLSAAFGARIGLAIVLLYILEGVAGLPVFAGASAGPLYILGPTGGFILGWLPMAYIIGRAADRGASNNFFKLFGAMVVGDAIVFAMGFGWLAFAATFVTNVGWLDQANLLGSAFAKAIQPFIVWDLLKLALAALTVAGGWQLVKSRKA